MKRTWLQRGISLSALTLAALIAIAFTAGLAIGQIVITTAPLIMPWIVTISPQDPDLKITSVTFGGYNAVTNTFASTTVTVHNFGTADRSGTVYVVLLDSDGNTIASGSESTGTVSAGKPATVTVSLTWVNGKTVDDVAGGRVVVVQS